jgi:hypothetical protein
MNDVTQLYIVHDLCTMLYVTYPIYAAHAWK